MIKKINVYILTIVCIFLYSCQTTKDALQGKKRSEQSDEFLVEKKNPLALPPDYDKLPTPGNQENLNKKNANEDLDLKKIIINNDDDQISQAKNEKINNENTNIENSVLKRILINANRKY